MADTHSAASNGAKAFGGLAAIALIASVVFGIFNLLGERITSNAEGASKEVAGLQRQIVELRAEMIRNSDDLRDEDMITREWIAAHDLSIPGVDAAQWERIKALERVTYGDALDVDANRR